MVFPVVDRLIQKDKKIYLNLAYYHTLNNYFDFLFKPISSK